MGLGAVKLTDMEEYIRVVYGLLNNEAVETTIEGKRQKIRFLNPEIGLINTKDRIPLHISAYGPRSQALTARLGAGWKTLVSDVPGAMSSIGRMQQSWRKAGRASGDLYATARKRESSGPRSQRLPWTPAFAGVTKTMTDKRKACASRSSAPATKS